MFWFIVTLVCLLNLSPIATIKTKCDNYCSSASYSLSSGLKSTSTCRSVDCLLQSEISVIERDHFDEYLNFTLISYGVSESETRSIGLQLVKPISVSNQTPSNILYSCAKLRSGQTNAKVTIETFSQPIGSSIYLNGNLYCSWIASRNDVIWPVDGTKRADLVDDGNYQLYLQVNESSVMVTNGSTSLPIYRRQYTRRCCQYRVRGSDNYQLITKRSADGQSTDFLVQFFNSSAEDIQLILTESNGNSLIVECSFADSSIKLTSMVGPEVHSLSKVLRFKKLYDNRCSWTLPDKIEINNKLTINLESTVYKSIEIVADQLSVYRESNVALTGLSWLIRANFLIVVLSVAVFTSIQ